MAMFGGKRPLINPDQRFGGGFDPVTGTMSLSGSVITDPITPPPAASTASTTKPGFFAPGGTGRTLVGYLGDAFQQLAGMQPTFAPIMQHQRALEAAEQQRQRQLQDQRDTWVMQQDYKRAHPDDQFTQYMRAAGIDPASPQGQALYRQRAESMATPPLVAVDGFDAQGNPTKTFMPRTGFGAGGQSAPAGPAVGTIKNGYRFQGGNPNDRNSWVPVGGASPAGGATFR